MRSLLAGLCLLGLTMTAAGQPVSGLVGPLDRSKKLVPDENRMTERNGHLYPTKADADAADKKIREEQELERGVAEKMAYYQALGQPLRDEQARKTDDWLWGFGIIGVLLVARVLWGLVGWRTGRAEPDAAADPGRV